MALPAILIIIMIGLTIGSWIGGGIVATMVYYGLELLSPSMFLFTICSICCIVTLAIPRQHWPMLLCSAWAFLALWNVATTLALTYIPSGQAALLGFTMPLWAALWSWLLFGHTLDGRQWLALLLGTAGWAGRVPVAYMPEWVLASW